MTKFPSVYDTRPLSASYRTFGPYFLAGSKQGTSCPLARSTLPQTTEAKIVDDKGKRDVRDRATVASGQDYEIRLFAEDNGISENVGRMLIERYGNDREA